MINICMEQNEKHSFRFEILMKLKTFMGFTKTKKLINTSLFQQPSSVIPKEFQEHFL